MRHALCIGGIFIAAALLSAPEAEAQFRYSGEGECNKGLFWPFVRNPGDCLTDAERRSGMTGTYRGSEVEQTDAGDEAAAPAPAAPAQAQQSPPTPAVGAPSEQASAPEPPQEMDTTAGATPVPASPAPAAGTAAVQPAAAQRAAPAAETAAPQSSPAAEDRATYTGPGGCTKGIFWPFVRRAGDCLTDAEVRSGMTGTFQ